MKAITRVFHLERYQLLLDFGGELRVVDLEPFLTGEVFDELRNIEEFRDVLVDSVAGTITWPNEADIDHPDVLYENSRRWLL